MRCGCKLGRRNFASSLLQELQQQPSNWDSNAGGSQAGGQQDRRERRGLSALVENTLVPELGSIAARCSRLISHASLAFSKPPILITIALC